MTVIWLLVGLGLIVLGADWLVEGASSIASVTHVDALVLLVSVALLLLWAHIDRGERIDRWEGSLMLLLFGIYYTYLFINL